MAAPRLLGQVRERIRVKHYSLHTEDAYLHWIRRLIFFPGKRHPHELGGPEVAAFLSHLATEGRVASPVGWLRHPHGAGIARALGCFDDDDLHARAQQGRPRRHQPADRLESQTVR